MSRTRKILLVGLLLVAVVATALLMHHFQGQSALAQYKSQLRARGELLTFSELTASYLADVPDSMGVITNAAIKLRQASFQPNGNGLMIFIAPGKARVGWKEPEFVWNDYNYRGRTNVSFTNSWAKFAAEMDAKSEPLVKIREAMKNPAPHLAPRTNYFPGVRMDFVSIRYAAQWLAGAALNELHRGDLEAALLNIEALAGLSNLNRDEYTLVSGMIRVAIAGLGEAATWEALQAHGWDEPQLERLQKACESVDLIQALENGFLGERAFGPEIFKTLRSSGYRSFQGIVASSTSKNSLQEIATEHLLFPAYKIASMDDDELFHLTHMQQGVEAVRMLEARRPWTAAKARQDKNIVEFEKFMGSMLWGYTHWVSVTEIPNFSRAMQTVVRKETQRQMTIAVIALKRYELRQGKLPATLGALVPEFLSESPFDCMSGQPLRYRLNADGNFLLYSVGDDGKDDGGDPTPAKSGDKPDFWNGRDAVWPVAVTDEPVKVPAGK